MTGMTSGFNRGCKTQETSRNAANVEGSVHTYGRGAQGKGGEGRGGGGGGGGGRGGEGKNGGERRQTENGAWGG